MSVKKTMYRVMNAYATDDLWADTPLQAAILGVKIFELNGYSDTNKWGPMLFDYLFQNANGQYVARYISTNEWHIKGEHYSPGIPLSTKTVTVS